MAAIFLALPAGLRAVAICDSTDGACGRDDISTAKSLESGNSSGAVEPAYRIPIGTIIVWHLDKMPEDADKWLECDGQAVSKTDYPQLYALMHNTPDYTNRFLRAGGSVDVGRTAEDTIKSHTLMVPQHDHSFSVTTKGSVNVLHEDGYMDVYAPSPIADSNSSSGSEAGPVNPAESKMDKVFMSVYLCSMSMFSSGSFIDNSCTQEKFDITNQRALASAKTGAATSSNNGHEVSYTRDYQSGKGFCLSKDSNDRCIKSSIVRLGYEEVTGALKASGGMNKVTYQNVSYAKSSSVSANTIKVPRLKAEKTAIDGETIQGRTDMAPQLRATYTGGKETAPKHIYVRYLIRAKN